MIEQQIREEFEKCMSQQAGIDLRKNANGQYFNYMLDYQLKIFRWGWLASRQALIVELPNSKPISHDIDSKKC